MLFRSFLAGRGKRFSLKPTKRKVLLFPIALLIIGAGVFAYVRYAQGAVRTWDGEGTEITCPGNSNGWSCAQNWSTDSIPGASDIATFDNTSDKDATIDGSFAGSVQGVDINSGYDGTITQSRSLTVGTGDFNQAAGNWTGGSQTLDINDGGFIVTGGVHTATTGTWTVEHEFTSSGGTLTMTGATVSFDGSSVNTDDTTLTCTGSLGGTVNIAKAVSGNIFTLASGCTIDLQAAISTIGGIVNNGTINHNSGSPTLNIDDGGLVNNSGGTYDYTGTAMTIEHSFTQSGTFDLTGITVTLDGNSTNTDDSTVTCTGSLGGTINVAKTGSGTDFTLASGCTISFQAAIATTGNITNNGTINHNSGSPTLDIGAGLFNNSGATYNYTGTAISLDEAFTQSGTFDLTGITVTFDGTSTADDGSITCSGNLGGIVNFAASGSGDTTIVNGCTVTTTSVNCDCSITNNGTWNHTGSTFNVDEGSGGSGIINNNGATITYSGTVITIESTFTQNGTFDLSGITITFDGSGNADDTTLTCSGTLGGTVNIAKTGLTSDFTLANGCTATLSSSIDTTGSIINNGTMNATNINTETNFTQNGTLNLSGTLTFDGSVSTSDSTLTCSGTFSPTVDVTKSGTGDFILSSNCSATLASNVNTNGPIINNGTLTATNIDTEQSFTQNGTLAMSGTLTLSGTSGTHDSTVSCTGSLGATVDVTKTSGGDFIVGSGCNITLASNIDVGAQITNNGTLNATNITNENNFTNAGTLNISGTLTFDGNSSTHDSTLTCGGSSLTHFVENKTSSGDMIFGDNCTITGNFTRTDGQINNPGAARTVVIQGNFSTSTTDLFGGANLTLEFGGTGAQTITQNAGSLSTPVRINKTSNHVTLLTTLTLDSTGNNVTIDDGELRNSTFLLTAPGTLTVNDTFTQGTGNVTAGTYTIGASGTYTNASTGDIIVGAGGVANSGTMNLGVQGSCPTTDDISITSSSGGNQRSWTGGGTFNFYDLTVQDQGGTAEIQALSSTNVSGNGDNWSISTSCIPSIPGSPRLQDGTRLRGGTRLN